LEVRATAAEVLARSSGVLTHLEEPRTLDPIALLLEDSDPLVCREASISLGKMSDVRGFEPLVKLLNSEPDDEVAGALSGLADPRVFDELTGLLKNKDPEIAGAGAMALARLGDSRAVGLFFSLLLREDEILGYIAVNAIETLGGPTTAEAIAPLLWNGRERVALLAAVLLARIADYRGLDYLIQRLIDDNTDVIELSAEALSFIPHVRSLQPLLQLLAAPEWYVRGKALRSIERILLVIGRSLDRPVRTSLKS
jgi:HEAT repeat protein